MNAIALALDEAMERAGAEVRIDVRFKLTEDRALFDGHLHIVRDPDPYRALCMVAEACGVELEDG